MAYEDDFECIRLILRRLSMHKDSAIALDLPRLEELSFLLTKFIQRAQGRDAFNEDEV